MREIKFRLGATYFTIGTQPLSTKPASRRGYARANGIHFDIFAVGGFGLQLSSLRLRESDTEHPECIGGYLRSDVAACPEIVGTVQPWGGGILESG